MHIKGHKLFKPECKWPFPISNKLHYFDSTKTDASLSRAILRVVLGTASEVTVRRRSLKGYLMPKFVFEVMVGAKPWKR